MSRISQLERAGISQEVYEDERRRMAEEERIIRESMEHRYEETIGEPVTTVRFALPHMRLPKPHKAAFRSAELFAQQRDLTKFDYGLQAVLDALCVAVNALTDNPANWVSLDQMDFTMNFTGAASETRKRFSVIMRQPDIGRFELVQSIGENMTSRRELIIDGRSFTFGRPVGQTTVTLTELPPEPVAVQNDHPTRESRVLDLDL